MRANPRNAARDPPPCGTMEVGMRIAVLGGLVAVLSLGAGNVAFAQRAGFPAPPAAAPAQPGCDRPNALGVARTVQIDTTGGPGFGFEHFKTHDFLRPKEVVLTFDDGPWPGRTPVVLAALASECVKATFFPVGKHAMARPDILKQVAEQGHTV